MKIKSHFSFLVLFFSLISLCAQNELSVATIFSDGMVIQRNQEVTIWGTATSNETVSIDFNSKRFITQTDSNGNWMKKLPKQQIGKSLSIHISTTKDTISINNILVGEVWLASGQSNMHLDLKRTLNGEEVAKRANNPNIRIYNMRPTYPTGKNGVHTQEELKKIQNNNYFNTNGWVKVTPENVLYFSAVAYYFAEKLQDELNIPIGIIHNAIPGSPIESWLSKKDIEQDSMLISFVQKRWIDKEDEKDGMINVAKNQISLSKFPSQMHPWMSNYGYENGILPINPFAIKGVIWYQGESNAEAPIVYKKMFSKMVQTWRSNWKQNFPFYYVQLTSREDRPAWPEFRNMQRELLKLVPNSKMIVITDVGDRQDTHAKNKKPVGERLALLALGDSYNKVLNYESPIFDKITKRGKYYCINFNGAFNGLKTLDGGEITGFEISKDNINFNKITPEIQNNSVKFKLPDGYLKSFYVRYAWKPFTEANLTSKDGMPTSTFKAFF